MKAFLSPWRVSCFTEIARTFNELIKEEKGRRCGVRGCVARHSICRNHEEDARFLIKSILSTVVRVK